MYKSDIVKAFEKAKINVIVIIDPNFHRITAIVEKVVDTKVVDDVFYRCLSVGIGKEIKVDKTLICNGVCFTEIKFLPEETKKRSLYERIINLIKY